MINEMKLGDNMAPVEACSVWNDICPLKSRPPKIGDIPRHVAVDDESPGCSSSKSSLRQLSDDGRSSKSSKVRELSKISQALPVIKDFFESSVSTISLVKALQNPDKIAPKFREKIEHFGDPTEKNSSDEACDRKSAIFHELGDSKLSDSTSGERSSKDDLPIYQIRKDSALYIEERNIVTSKDDSTEIRDKAELENSWKLSKPRTRRESSGYFSNFGTFDEDRWTASPMDVGNQQNVMETSRRRSSTKSRLPMTFNQQQQQLQPIEGTIGLQRVQRSTKIEETLLSSSESSDRAKSVMKSSNVEMPEIAEQTSLELEKPMIFMDNLSKSVSEMTLKDSPEKCLDVSMRDDYYDEKNEKTRICSRKILSKDESALKNPETWSNVEKDVKIESSEIEIEISDEDDDDDVVTAITERNNEKIIETDSLPRPIKVYQLLSTQSEDRNDGETGIYDRRVSLEITRRNQGETSPDSNDDFVKTEKRNSACSTDEKKLIHADSVPILKIGGSSNLPSAEMKSPNGEIVVDKDASRSLNLASSSSRTSLRIDERINLVDKTTGGSKIAGPRPIYPYCPYSPYASPQGSPRTNRRRPLRESRRVSIDSRQGALQLNQYKLLNNIGQGSYGIVKLAYNEEDDNHYAMKILSKKKLMKKAGIFGRIAPGRKGSANPLAKVYREIALLKKLDHPNVVKLVEVLDDPDEDNLYLVFELVQRGEVLQVPTDKPLDEDTARKYFRDVVMGVEYLHYQRIVHRDIKPSNLLVDSEGRVKVADLGVSAELRAAGELLSGLAGTPAFAAPETTIPGAQYSGTLCDVWSMGVTLYSLVIGKVPWDGAGSIIGVQAAIRSEQLRFPVEPCISKSLNDLVSRMLDKDPSRRMNLGEIKEHRWLTNNGNEPLPNETENCRLPVTVTDEEVARVVTRVPKLDTLILIKTMLKQHSFQNPFLPRRFTKTIGEGTSGVSSKQRSSIGVNDSTNDEIFIDETPKTKTEQFQNAGRSNSAPDSYDWQINGRQISSDSLLPPVRESTCQEGEIEKR